MAKSACQKKGQSCAACCGLYNLDLERHSLYALLRERSKRFQEIPKDYPAPAMVAFRQERERAEKEIARKDPEVYVCPFLGFLEDTKRRKKPGCLAHPSRTGQENSQNFSFYGASICQTYDCRTKEEDALLYWSELCAFLCPDSYDYGRLYADYFFFRLFCRNETLIETLWRTAQNWQSQHGRSFQDSWNTNKFQALPQTLRSLYCLAHTRLLCQDSQKITSFELEYLKSDSAPWAQKSHMGTRQQTSPKNFLEEALKNLLSDAIGKKLPGSGIPVTTGRIADWVQGVLASV